MKPVARGLIKYESLLDCTLDLGDVYRLNEMIDVETENTWRAQKALEAKTPARPRR